MTEKTILLVEGDPDDLLMTLRALRKANVRNEVVVARDGQEALDYLFAEGAHAARDAGATPQFILLEPKLPKVSGFEVLERLRADERTYDLPVAVFASSGEEQDLMDGRGPGNVCVRKPVDVEELSRATRKLGLRWMVVDGSRQGLEPS